MQLGSIKGVLSNLGTRYGYALDTFQEWRGVEPLTRRSSDFHRSSQVHGEAGDETKLTTYRYDRL